MLNSASQQCRVAVVQMSSSATVVDNLVRLKQLFEQIDAQVDLVVLPENFAQMPVEQKKATEPLLAETPGWGLVQDTVAELAREYGVWIVAGTIPLISSNEQEIEQHTERRKVFASCLVFDEQGEIRHRYANRHLFDVTLSSGHVYRESDRYRYGALDIEPVVQSPWGMLGLSVCYDLRFPEHYRSMPDATVIYCVPAAFTYETGLAHWDILLRARAIENQCFVLGAAQAGLHDNGRKTWGHSSIVDPWGAVLNVASPTEQASVIISTLDLAALLKVREKFPCLQHKRSHI